MKYRLSRYGDNTAWQIEKWSVPERGKNKGVGSWEPHKYPGNLKNAAEFLINYEMGDFTAEDGESIVVALENAATSVLDALERHFESESEFILEIDDGVH